MAKKVYELATEIGVGAIDLVEKLKSMGFNVRNHMASLTDDEVVKAKAAYETPQKSSGPAKKAVVRKVIKKEAAPASAASPAPAEEAPSVKEAAPVEETEAPVVHAAPPVAAAAPAAPVASAPPSAPEKQYMDDKPRGLTIVKRKTKAQKDEEDKKASEAKAEAAAQAADAAIAAKEDGPAPASSYNTSRNAPAKKEYYEEKRHTFTPIFTPEAKKPETPEKKTEARLTPKPFGAPDEPAMTRSEERRVGKECV